jgi:hypothetical protein
MPNPAKSLPKNLDLIGNYCRLESLKEAAHGQDLWQFIGSKKDVWTYLINGPWENATEVPIGNYWLYGLGKDSKIELYSGDGSNPSVVGSYFTALIFYRYFTARPLDDVDYFPSEIKADDIKMIKLLAAAKL